MRPRRTRSKGPPCAFEVFDGGRSMKSFARIRSISSAASLMLDLLSWWIVDCGIKRKVSDSSSLLSELMERWVRNAQRPPARSQRERRPSRAGCTTSERRETAALATTAGSKLFTSVKVGAVLKTAVEAGVVMMENPSGPIGGGVVVVVEVGVTKLQGEGRMKLSPANPQLAIGCTFQDQI